MSFLSKLRSIGADFSKLKSFSFIKITTNIDNSIHIGENGGLLSVNPDLLPPKQRAKFVELIVNDGLDEAGSILDESTLPTLTHIREELPAIQRDTQKFIPLIPSQDIPLLQACLYLRQRHSHGDKVEGLKAQIIQSFGARGRNLANLCSAGYLENWLGPLSDELFKAYPDNPAKAKEKFLCAYNALLSDLPWTEFVSYGMSRSKIIGSIVSKMERNLGNGVRYLNVHGLGEKNVSKVLSMLSEIEEKIAAVPVKIEQDRASIFVRLEIPES